MKKMLVACVLSLGLLAASSLAAEWTGFISDQHCGAMHMDGSQKSIDCVTSCVKSGQAPVFVTMDKQVHKLSNGSAVSAYLGKKVKITGTMKGDTVTVEKVTTAE